MAATGAQVGGPPLPLPLHHLRVELVDAARQVGGAPLAVDAGGAGGAVGQLVPPAALEEDLPIVLDLAHVRAVVVEAHVAHEEHFSALYVAGELAVDELAARRHAGPVAKVTSRRVLSLEDETVLALEERSAAVVGARHLRGNQTESNQKEDRWREGREGGRKGRREERGREGRDSWERDCSGRDGRKKADN